MSATEEERTAAADFGQRYAVSGADAATTVERLVLGSDFGANGYTTMAQARVLAERLSLGRGSRLLDVGAGCGWPGLHLAVETGCEVVSTDLPVEGLRRARTRSAHEGLTGRSSAVLASARQLPFRDTTFDAIVHTDVLC